MLIGEGGRVRLPRNIVRTDRDRLARPFNCLIVLLQREIAVRFAAIPILKFGSRGLT